MARRAETRMLRPHRSGIAPAAWVQLLASSKQHPANLKTCPHPDILRTTRVMPHEQNDDDDFCSQSDARWVCDTGRMGLYAPTIGSADHLSGHRRGASLDPLKTYCRCPNPLSPVPCRACPASHFSTPQTAPCPCPSSSGHFVAMKSLKPLPAIGKSFADVDRLSKADVERLSKADVDRLSDLDAISKRGGRGRPGSWMFSAETVTSSGSRTRWHSILSRPTPLHPSHLSCLLTSLRSSLSLSSRKQLQWRLAYPSRRT